MSTVPGIEPRARSLVIGMDRLIYHVSRHWVLAFSLLFGLYVGLPWLAPVFMHWGWIDGANLIYAIYSTQCHQMPQRSFFLYCPVGSHSLAQIQAAYQNTDNPLILRQFVGNADLGWKVAWSDRMVAMYTSMLPFAWIWVGLRHRVRPMRWRGLFLCLLPMAVDGGTHMISDLLGGVGGGFRYTNAWLAVLTHNVLPATFYVGDSLGSFNSSMRLATGVIFAFGVVFFLFPYLQATLDDVAHNLEDKFSRSGLGL